MRLQKIPADLFAALRRVALPRTRHPRGARPRRAPSSNSPGNLPYDVQRLAHETWDECAAAGRRTRDGSKTCTPRCGGCSPSRSRSSRASWQRLTLAQRAVLRAVVLEDGRDCCRPTCATATGSAGRPRSRPRSPALVQRGPRARDGHARYVVVDSLMREWIARRPSDVTDQARRLEAAGSHGSASTGPSCARGRCTTGPTRPSVTTIITAVFPIYFARRRRARPRPAARRRAGSRPPTTLALRHRARSRRCSARSPTSRRSRSGCWARSWAIGVAATAAMFFIGQGRLAGWPAVAVRPRQHRASSGSFVFYDSLLPHIARQDEIDRVSTAGYALGYLGGGLLLAANLAWILSARSGLPFGDGLTPLRPRCRRGSRSCRVAVVVGRLLDPALPHGAGAAGQAAAAAGRRGPAEGRASSGLGDTFRELRAVQAGAPHAARVPDLQRRHRHHHPHGRDLRHRARHPASHR